MRKKDWKNFLGRRQRAVEGYELDKEIAKGGMSRVYRAHHKADNETVAIKIITPEHSQLADVLEQVFKKGSEGEVAASLQHQNIVHTHNYGRFGDQYYIVMEFVDGPNLKQLIDSADPRWRNHRFEILLAVGRGLYHIHANDLIHRDFCPKNILLDRGAVPKIIDFGLAIPGTFEGKWQFDRSGTASYMAPEQVRGQQVDVRTDVYAFGVSAYEILSGKRPFPESKTRLGKMEPHLNSAPIPLRQLDPTLPLPLDNILAKAIAKTPADRYQAMDVLMKDLQIVASAFFPHAHKGTG